MFLTEGGNDFEARDYSEAQKGLLNVKRHRLDSLDNKDYLSYNKNTFISWI